MRKNEKEEKIFDDISKIADIIIHKDNNPMKSYNRIKILHYLNENPNSESILKEKLQKGKIILNQNYLNFHYNDSYRLKKKFAEEIFKFLKSISLASEHNKNFNIKDQNYIFEKHNEEINDNILNEISSKNIVKYIFFLSTDKKSLVKNQEIRIIDMINKGLVDELNFLIKNELINETNVYKSLNNNNFINAFGLTDTLDFLYELMNSDFYKINKLYSYNFERYIDQILSIRSQSSIIYKIIYKYFNEFATKNRKYSRKQIKFFRNETNSIVWKYLNSVEEEKLVNDILKIVELSVQDYEIYLQSDENKINFEKIATFDDNFKFYKPNFDCLKIENGLFKNKQFVKKVLRDSIACINENTNKLKIFYKLKFNENIDNENTNLENSQPEQSSQEILSIVLRLTDN